jgi:imidazolonepropionase-like amidohydrolase
MPQTLAAGRFLAPAERYFPSLLPEPAPEEEIASLALAELARGARWVKIIADFPWVVDGEPTGDSEPTYAIETISAVVSAVHDAGGRVAVHANTSFASALVEAGADSIEHGTALAADDLVRMAGRGTAWTPTLCAIFGSARDSDPAELLRRRAVVREHLVETIPQAARMGVPILAGTDAAGTIADEIRLLAEFGLDPTAALQAATTSAYGFLQVDPGRPGERATVVTYDDDPRDDPRILGSPRAVVIGGRRLI